MARPIAAEKLGYYPAHPRAVRWIAQKIRADPGAVLVDPCAGEGSAVALLATELGIPQSHVVAAELHYERGARLAERLPGACITQPVDFQSAEFARAKATLLYLNPPFDAELNASGTRTEQMFLARASGMLKPSGVLAFVAPDVVANRVEVKQYLTAHYKDLTCHVFPAEHRPYREVLILGNRRARMSTDGKWWEAYKAGAGDGYRAAEGEPFEIVKKAYTTEELAKAIAVSGFAQKVLRGHSLDGGRELSCPMELGDGHIALLLAAGHLNGLVVADGYPPHVVRGTARKVQFEKDKTVEIADGKRKEKVVTSEKIELVIRIATQDGTIRTLDD